MKTVKGFELALEKPPICAAETDIERCVASIHGALDLGATPLGTTNIHSDSEVKGGSRHHPSIAVGERYAHPRSSS